MLYIIDGGGGGSYRVTPPKLDNQASRVRTSRQPRVHLYPYTEALLAKRLGYPYFGFLLYHSGHPRIEHFLKQHLTFLDHATGPNFALFTIVEKHSHPLQIDELLSQYKRDDKELWAELRKWRRKNEPFTPDRSFRVAEKLRLSADDLPCIILFRSTGQRRQSFALFKVKDAWFPEVPPLAGRKSMASQMRWFTKFCNALNECVELEDQRQALQYIQNSMDNVAKRQRLNEIGGALMPMAKLPYRLLEALPNALEKYVENRLSGKGNGA